MRGLESPYVFFNVHVRVSWLPRKNLFQKIFASSGSIPEIPFSRSCDFLFCLKGGDGKSLN
nr:MAG TPA: hypothetical protein [Caudoviricetes sp.]